jgi:predicted NUDIX family NTP pyrophosphohydrolase
MRPVGGELVFLHEVDRARWLPVAEAAAVLSYPRDAELLDALRVASLAEAGSAGADAASGDP